MAQNDVVDLDPFIQELENSQMIDTPEPVADLPYPQGSPRADVKNFLASNDAPAVPAPLFTAASKMATALSKA